MRTAEEKQLAVLSFQKDKADTPEFSFFGDNNHKTIDLSIDLIEAKVTIEEIEEMRDNEELTDTEYMNIDSVNLWIEGQGDDLEEMLFNPDNLVTELPSEEGEKPSFTICPNMCKECPFSNKSAQGWISDYTPEDFQKYMNAEVSFPCHMQMPEGDDFSPEACKTAIAKGEAKLCRGYVESIIKSCKKIHGNDQLNEAIEIVREQGLSDDSMPIWEFVKHHDLSNLKKNE